jgi:putative ABC transport system permease protein
MLTDLRFAFRALLRNRGFSVAAILTLALGLGATTAIFSVVNGVLLRSLPYTEADRIVTLETMWRTRALAGGNVSGPDFRDWQSQASSFEAMAYTYGGEMGVKAGQYGEFTGIFIVTPDFFKVMRAAPVAGRLFSPEEEKPNGANAALVSSAFARSHYGEIHSALGRVLRIASQSFPIIGVLRDDFHYPIRGTTKANIWLPAAWVGENTHRSGHNYRAIARLKPGIDLDHAQAEMNAIAARLEQAYPKDDKDKEVLVLPLRANMTNSTRATLQMLMGAVGLLLLLACANVANMLLARATSRTRELALRAAVGASRWQIVRQLLVESALLAGLAGIAGFIIAMYATDALLAFAPQNLPRADEIRLDMPVILFMAASAGLATFLFGLIPALQASRVDLNEALKQGGQKGMLGGGSHRLRNALVIAEIAISLMLTVSAGLLFRSFVSLTNVDMGFRPEHLLVMSTSVAAKDEESVKRATYYFRDLLRDLRSIPGVQSAAAVMGLPTGKRTSDGAYSIEGRSPAASLSSMQVAGFRIVTPGYFDAMRTPLLHGRDFEERDTYDAPMVAIVNQTFARREFPNADAIGKRIECGLDRKGWMTIVGIVGDVRHDSPSKAPRAEIYMAYHQHPWVSDEMHVVLRSNSDVAVVTREAEKIAAALNPEVSLSFSTMQTFLAEAVATPRFRTVLMGAFAGIAALLAMAGVYGVMSYVVGQRVSELGLRLAIGATTFDILRLVLGQALRVTCAGLALGLALSAAASRVLTAMLYGVQTIDPSTYAASVLGIGVVAVAAAAAPSIRAARIDPVEALRAE